MIGTSSTADRKGKRRWSHTLQQQDHDEGKATQRAEKSEKSAYACTFCWKPYKDRRAWSRHEKTHVGPELWTCMPDGLTTVHGVCLFCSHQPQSSRGGTLGQLLGSLDRCRCQESQHVANCLKKPAHERAFSTKAGLKHHIRRMHNPENAHDDPRNKARIDAHIAYWSRTKSPSELPDDTLWCGFCKESFGTWEARVDHVAAHFRKRCQPNKRRYSKHSPTPGNNNNGATREVSDNTGDKTLTPTQRQNTHDREAVQRIRDLEGELAILRSSAMSQASDDERSDNLDSPHTPNE
ncbi:MAG: hypothetical protein Q9165_004391 [Trypethelium subeluteriae]